MSTLEIKNLHAQVLPNEEGAEPKPILKGVNLTVNSGETHAIMGPNGSGKSTLSYVIAGHPRYEVTDGEVLLDGENILDLEVDERARAGLFLAMQYPTEVAGVKMSQFMRSAVTAVRGEAPKLREWNNELKEARERLHIDKSFIARSVNEGFSGGEKKRHEVMQLDLLKPKFAVMDETDSGLDVDALRIVSDGINSYQEETKGGIIMITHYQRILNYVVPDFVHIFSDGQIIKTGGAELAHELENSGYEQFI
ncbi:Fe-S cluster assembly ATPase SufC [Corynebacterium stationis]|uniref:Fe-S cluster assembly ATPase SufC n=1 Tax=Corynebacterium stationis TaxID=1705 RepID=UPI0026166A21|nr:Fe-S cluster assembly ATPase SufC [Corynebacterium stationis]WLP86651.1 Fe-S cluster assembly ATPase SufC [Corynebacterium stationis]